ncbi:MAG TPA: hypothetical protein VM344_08820 [Vitreimonas sp.]|nr:hypothetical protein [Vitreimonas sp.]
MPPERSPEAQRERFTVIVEALEEEEHAWLLTVRELPRTWTVTFSQGHIEAAARQRIALDLGCGPHDFDIAVEPRGSLFLERRHERPHPPS